MRTKSSLPEKEKHVKTLKDAEEATPEKLTEMAPPQVDELFAAVYEKFEQLRHEMHNLRQKLHVAVGDKKKPYKTSWGMSYAEVEKLADAASPDSPAGQVRSRMQDITKEQQRLTDGVWVKLNVEFDRRGQWSRIYLVTGGHAHNTSECSTCHNGEFRTQMQWMIEWSGRSQAEMIAAIADRACTICYPDAPVNRGKKVAKSVLLTDEERDLEAERAERTAAKAKRAAAKAEKAITDEDGGPLKVHTWTKKAHQEQRRGTLVDIPEQSFYDTLATLHAARGWLTDQVNPGRYNDATHRDIGRVADAIAHKEDKDRTQVIAEARERARKRR